MTIQHMGNPLHPRPKLTLWEKGQNPAGYCIEGLARIPTYEDFYGQPRTLNWLWEPYLARGTLAVLDGDPGVGKSLIAIDLLARVIENRPMPDGSPSRSGPNQQVIYTNNEDHQDLTVMPRFAATNCSCSPLLLFGGISDVEPPVHPAQFPHDWPAFVKFVRVYNPPLVVLDSFTTVISPAICTNHDQSIRQALTPFAKLAAETGTCILFLRHPTKARAMKSLYQGAGSVAIISAMRTSLYAGKHPAEPGTFVLAMAKSNLGIPAPSLQYRISTRPLYRPHPHGPPAPLPPSAGIDWLGITPLTANDLCAAANSPAGTRAIEWLRNELDSGPLPANDLIKQATTHGIPECTLRMAKNALGITSKRIVQNGKARWEWGKGKAELDVSS